MEKPDENGIAISGMAFRERLRTLEYSGLYNRLITIGTQVKHLPETGPEIRLLQMEYAEIRRGMDELCRHEEETMLPLLLQLEHEHKKADSCSIFKKAGAHYRHTISALHRFKIRLSRLADEKITFNSLPALSENVLRFEELLISLHRCKEQTIFKAFRNCNKACKML